MKLSRGIKDFLADAGGGKRCRYNGKVRYKTEAEALAMAKKYRKFWGSKMDAYKHTCGDWHIGHTSKRPE